MGQCIHVMQQNNAALKPKKKQFLRLIYIYIYIYVDPYITE
jgi:hypothetical protein